MTFLVEVVIPGPSSLGPNIPRWKGEKNTSDDSDVMGTHVSFNFLVVIKLTHISIGLIMLI